MAKKFAKKDKTPKLSLVTPKGRALFVYLKEPNKRFNPENEKKECSIILDRNEPAVQEFIAKVDGFAEECGVKSPIKDGKSEGDAVLKAKTSYAVPVFDANRNTLPDTFELNGGSTIKLAICMSPYENLGGGITCYLQGVQVIKPTAAKNAAALGFGEEDGYIYEEPAEVAPGGAEEVPF